MRAHVATAGVVFSFLVIAHIVRVAREPHLVRVPFFVIATILAAALACWSGWLLLRRR